jgi:hypothetical protein
VYGGAGGVVEGMVVEVEKGWSWREILGECQTRFHTEVLRAEQTRRSRDTQWLLKDAQRF